ncbi:PemK family transcriptional regulator [Candidatus Azambacteria bacterium RIFCSPHIGHO2_02_FULL_52_12]|uniref:mRNA interferase n=1 Tax=Candidatus Azambacteria bacterium RIFCSPLOWO2_01_FULL_46_25 TaxID=1797298 RepID=A0A1F5BUW9_9BACT|nr:MAG: PemK family transcriptional regulator [Candidatus Azambacteria bacterium RIFCSPHIGHO2_02_FULL_52_12]OGD34414.1 MAG: PemK family transcriptional regulator [Candidatus Azambacteria bacterium RIFCSPLOWO2_01_FULL_46_25]OGD37308.1 MAG: PemK family transcriptional regulator [Candidatus Azambacteria bacterium RIFCSPHIGHO2_01_FULL_51_74]
MISRRKAHYPKRGEIWVVNFDPTIGSEIQKTRPALILQNNIANQYSSVTIVAAITSQANDEAYPTEVSVQKGEGGLEKESAVLLNQIRTIDKQRLVRKLGAVNQEIMEKVEQAIEISLGLIEI